jgi:DNA modification methylase
MRGSADIHFHTSETMTEVAPGSARLLIGASVYLGKDVGWDAYEKLYRRVYVEQGLALLRDDGFFVVLQTDAYEEGSVLPKNVLLPKMLMDAGYRLIDEKVWRRRKADHFQVPFSSVWVFVKPGAKHTRKAIKGNEYFQGIWDYPQAKGGELAAFPEPLCRMMVEAFTEPGDLIVDPFAGTGMLLGVAASLGRRAVGYEINETLRPIIEDHIRSGLAAGERAAAAPPPAPTPAPTAPTPPTAPGQLSSPPPAPVVSGPVAAVRPEWRVGNSLDVIAAMPPEELFDLIFTCPPYGDLEVYSDDPADLSVIASKDRSAFLVAYREIIKRACAHLRQDRFAAIVVGDYRDRQGFYANFVSETIAAFIAAGLSLYNEAVLVTTAGTLPVRIGRQFAAGRKLGKMHQNVLVFVKGDPKRATEACGVVEVASIESLVEDAAPALDGFEDEPAPMAGEFERDEQLVSHAGPPMDGMVGSPYVPKKNEATEL